jgi:Holliday junction resolvasome RuvABC DNA-binding subunit
MLAHVDFLDEALELCSDEIEQRLRPVTADVERLCTIPGVKHKTAQLILAELERHESLSTHQHLAAWLA